jgi:glycosyltransferase involved in cell wall biosynthesis
MIRVGFIIANTDGSWMGGLNYLTNLLHAVANLPNRKIEPVLITTPDCPIGILSTIPAIEVIRTSLIDNNSKTWRIARKISEIVFGCDYVMVNFLKRNNISVLSHAAPLGKRSKIPTLGWLADFQHQRMPGFFSVNEIAKRNKAFSKIASQSKIIILSSCEAQRDLDKFMPSKISNSRVLSFTSGFSSESLDLLDENRIRTKYNITGQYFHLPNQFWKHKNHRIVIDALTIIKQQNLDLTVICTGQTKDHRWPLHFEELQLHANQMGVSERFRVLGLVPYVDMTNLMYYSSGVINPSLFEGWSTTVEECKSLGVTTILSDIPVHREQCPERGIYFDPYSAESLAEILIYVFNKHDLILEKQARISAKVNKSLRFSNFGLTYQEIVMESLNLIN